MRYQCDSCNYSTDSRVNIKDHAAILGHFGWRDAAVVDTSEFEDLGYLKPEPEPAFKFSDFCDFKTLSMEMTFGTVNAEALGILTGGVMGTPPPPSFALEMWAPIKRTFWQWLRRKPRQYTRYYIPNARLTQEEDS